MLIRMHVLLFRIHGFYFSLFAYESITISYQEKKMKKKVCQGALCLGQCLVPLALWTTYINLQCVRVHAFWDKT